MTELSTRNYGLLVAYFVPGFVLVLAVSRHSPTLEQWLGASPADAPTVGGFLFVTLASVGAGMTASALRWLLLDAVHHRTGVPRPDWNFSRLQSNLAAFDALANHHFRYYQFYGNTLVAFVVAAVLLAGQGIALPFSMPVMLLTSVALAALFFLASRDALRKYYARTAALLPESSPSSDSVNRSALKRS